MLYSHLFGKTKKEVKKYDSISHQLLTQAGFIDQIAAGIYNLLPLGKRVLAKIENIIREEMNKIGAQELEMPLLHPKTFWETTDRWQTVDVLFKTKSQYGQEYALAPTHEETITPLVKKFLKSYRDLPLALYHITKKFRDEPRPKSGILRGREFGMKDLYSFHQDKNGLKNFYQTVIKAYLKIFKRCGFNNVKITEASGGSFTKKYSHEFNVITPAGEVNLIYCQKCSFAQNIEISQLDPKKNQCPKCRSNLKIDKAIEIGNIFDLGTRFSQAFNLIFIDKNGEKKFPVMGCYGIGTTRIIGAIVEISHDDRGIIWPKNIAPYQAHLIGLDLKDKDVKNNCDKIYNQLLKDEVEVLFDDREEATAGEKFADADLIGIPVRLVVSKKTGKKIEYKKRGEKETKLLALKDIINQIKN
ncbi:MAG: His/Gly/Thr/Pro-type tRNA ligase C-terminal domain-containing protein [Patescibacteria group bacterium]|nr:His/Gly/Thr/Pro-type tRNA ligase C-terminal domain-containing protein [Patescibacteria group bacterium]